MSGGPPYGHHHHPHHPHYPPHDYPPPPPHYPPHEYPPPPPPGHYPPYHPHPHYPPPHHHHSNYPPTNNGASFAYIPVPMIPVPVPYPEVSQPQSPAPLAITHPATESPTPTAPVLYEDLNWVPTTATNARNLEGRAFVGGHEGWDGSPLWVIRARHGGDLIPGKLAVRHNSAYVPYDGKEITVQNIEVLCCNPNKVRWVPSSHGQIPVGAIPGGQTASGETLYIGRVQYQLALTPGKIHPTHGCLYISFGGSEHCRKIYDILCHVV